MILGLAVAALWGTGDLAAALASRRTGALWTLTVAQSIELAICLVLWLVIRPSTVNGADTIAGLLVAGVLTAVAYGALYRGFALGPVMLVGPIAAAYAIGPTILAVVVLHERLPVDGAIGAAAAIAGVVAVTAGRAGGSERQGARVHGGVPFAFAAMLGFGMSAFVIAAFAQRTGWLPTLLISRVGVAITLALVAVGPGRRALVGAKHRSTVLAVALAAIAGIGNLAGTALYARGGELGIVAVVTPVSALFPLVPVLGGYLLFHERPRPLQIAGIGMIVAGLVLLG